MIPIIISIGHGQVKQIAYN